jgi:hypothetical protein
MKDETVQISIVLELARRLDIGYAHILWIETMIISWQDGPMSRKRRFFSQQKVEFLSEHAGGSHGKS